MDPTADPLIRATLLTVTALLAAGCVGAQGAPTGQEGEALTAATMDWPMVPVCDVPGFESRTDGVCARFFRTGSGEEWEPHLATHPTDPDTMVLVGNNLQVSNLLGEPTYAYYDAFIWAAVTEDAGVSWTLERLSDPALNQSVPSEFGRFSFDPTVAFATDGTIYVLFIGEGQGPDGRLLQRLTVARSGDLGRTWTYHRFHETIGGLPASDDYTDIAVAPDTGRVHIVTDEYSFKGALKTVRLYTSDDRAETWDSVELYPAHPPAEDGYIGPRVAAGPGGLVVVGTHLDPAVGSDTAGIAVWTSRDSGATFEGPVHVEGPHGAVEHGMQPVIWTPPGGTPRIDVVYDVLAGIAVLRSNDAASTWEAPRRLSDYPPGTVGQVGEAAAGHDGSLFVLERYGNAATFGAALVRLGPAADAPQRMVLTEATESGAPSTGGHYGGLAASSDGSVWSAWGDPRGEGGNRIAAVHLAAPAS